MKISRLTRFLVALLGLTCVSWTDLGFAIGGWETIPGDLPRERPVPLAIPQAEIDAWVAQELSDMTLEEKIGQLLLIDFDMRGISGISSPAEAVRDLHIGGVLVRRTMDMDRLPNQLDALQRLSRRALFVAADFERGAGRHNNHLTQLPSTMALGAARDAALSEQAGMVTAVESRSIGVNLAFAPVVDVNNNAENPIINTRSYGENPVLVAEMAEAWVRGAETYGLLTTLKHFPGHGNTSVDSHTNLGVVPGTRATLDAVELYPYRRILRSRTPPSFVMTAHLSVPALDPTNTPATFSRPILEGVLRREMGFDGVILTDGINMGAITKNYSFEESILRPIEAGADIILLPTNPRRAFETLRSAVRSGRITEARISESVERILKAKGKIGLHRSRQDGRRLASFSTIDMEMGVRGVDVARAIAEKSITLLKSDQLPLRTGQRVSLIQLSHRRSSSEISAAMSQLKSGLESELSVKEIQAWSNDRLTSRTLRNAFSSADVVVLAMYLRVTEGRGSVGLTSTQEETVKEILRQNKPVILVTFGNPYVVRPYGHAESVIVAYDQSTFSAEAVANRILGRITAQGQFPVTAGSYLFGSGLEGDGSAFNASWDAVPEARQVRRDF